MTRILIVDDEEKIREMIGKFALHEGYEVAYASDGSQALSLYEKEKYDVVIMDIMMPNMDGYETLKRMKEIREVSCIFLSALGRENDKIYGFDLGCDDYVVKPFSLKELMMRIKVILRKNGQANNEIHIGSLCIDRDARLVSIDKKRIPLSFKEYELLDYLLENRGIAISREKIINNVWGYEYYSDDRTLDTHIKMLRKDLGEYGSLISTVRGVGYRFEKED